MDSANDANNSKKLQDEEEKKKPTPRQPQAPVHSQTQKQIRSYQTVNLANFADPAAAAKCQCIICYQVPLPEFAFIHDCGKIFCKADADHWADDKSVVACPNCRQDFIIVPCKNNRFAYSSLIELSLRCIASDDCKWTGQLDSLHAHLKECDFVVKPCKYQPVGCSFAGANPSLKLHYATEQDAHLELLQGQHQRDMSRIKETERKLEVAQDFVRKHCEMWQNGSSILAVPEGNDDMISTTRHILPKSFEADVLVTFDHVCSSSKTFELGVSLSPLETSSFKGEKFFRSMRISTWCIISDSHEKLHGEISADYGEALDSGDTVTIKCDRMRNLSFARNGHDFGPAFVAEGELYLYAWINSGAKLRILRVNAI